MVVEISQVRTIETVIYYFDEPLDRLKPPLYLVYRIENEYFSVCDKFVLQVIFKWN